MGEVSLIAPQPRLLEAVVLVRRYCRPRLLILDEIGYFVHAGRAADLFFEVISQRYGEPAPFPHSTHEHEHARSQQLIIIMVPRHKPLRQLVPFL